MKKKQSTALEALKTPMYDKLEAKEIEKFAREFMATQKKNAFVAYVYGTEEQLIEFWRTVDIAFKEEIKRRFPDL